MSFQFLFPLLSYIFFQLPFLCLYSQKFFPVKEAPLWHSSSSLNNFLIVLLIFWYYNIVTLFLFQFPDSKPPHISLLALLQIGFFFKMVSLLLKTRQHLNNSLNTEERSWGLSRALPTSIHATATYSVPY